MELPEGKTCTDCRRFGFCSKFIGPEIAVNTHCDWFPIRFVPAMYNRPDIVILRSIADASDEIREELKAIGEEKRYVTALRMLVKHAHTIDSLSKVLIERFERAGDDGAVFYEEPEP